MKIYYQPSWSIAHIISKFFEWPCILNMLLYISMKRVHCIIFGCFKIFLEMAAMNWKNFVYTKYLYYLSHFYGKHAFLYLSDMCLFHYNWWNINMIKIRFKNFLHRIEKLLCDPVYEIFLIFMPFLSKAFLCIHKWHMLISL